METLIRRYKRWKYHNTFFLLLSVCLLIYLINIGAGKQIMEFISSLGYAGSFLAGMFSVSLLTVAPATIVLFNFAETHDALLVVFTAALGAVVGDYIIFRFMKDFVFEEIKPVFMKLGGSNIVRLLHTPYFMWLAPVIGAMVIVSPFPDEVGVSLMGISKLKPWQFLILSFILNSIGALLVVVTARVW